MSETTEGGNEGGQTPPAEGFTPITTQDDLNRIIGERLERERAKFSDYDDLKTKASKYDELDEANKSEAQRLNDQLAAEKSAREQAEATALRYRVASKHGVSEEDAELFLTGSDEDTLTKQAERLSDRVDQQRRQGNHVPREGAPHSKPAEDEVTEFARSLFESAEQ